MMRPLEIAMRWFRRRRMRQFIQMFGVTTATRILDVGGTLLIWRLLDERPRVTLANMPGTLETDLPGFDWVSADGCRLPFADGAFDIVFSNSVIEHVGSPQKQKEFADEIRRVGKRYWVQTPNRWYPIEPHLLTPFLHFLPRRWQAAIVRRWTLWQTVQRPTEHARAWYVEHYLRDIRLLTAPEMKQLFPDGIMLRERHLGMTKSIVMCRL